MSYVALVCWYGDVASHVDAPKEDNTPVWISLKMGLTVDT